MMFLQKLVINTIKVEGSDLIGFNTDYLGFMKAYKKQLSANKKCLVLGDGGHQKVYSMS